MVEPWAVDLTEEQMAAASHSSGPACVLAGPGTGKTLTITRHVLFLAAQGIDAESIRAITFTRRAAAELRGRLREALGSGTSIPGVSTLHSFALSVLLQAGQSPRLPQPIRIVDDWEERWILQEDLKRIMELARVDEVEDLFNDLSADWDCLDTDEQDRPSGVANPEFVGAWHEHRAVYGYTLRAEMVFQLKRALEEGAEALAFVPDHLIVDEYQDLNPCDLAVVQSLAEMGAQLYASGDDDQSIYGFRHARPQAIREFTDEHDGSVCLPLEVCHRCSNAILDTADYVIRQDRQRRPKVLRCRDGACAGTVEFHSYRDQHEEAQGVVSICRDLMGFHGVEPHEILILVRQDHARAFSSVLIPVLTANNIPVNLATDPLAPLNPDGQSPKGGRYLLAVLRLLVNEADDLAWRTALQICPCGVGWGTFSALNEMAVERGCRFAHALALVCEEPGRIQRGNSLATAANGIRSDVNTARDCLQRAGALTGFVEEAADQFIDDDGLKSDVVTTLSTAIEELELDLEPDPDGIEALLRGMATSLGLLEQATEPGCVNLMTMHQAKGLSANAVIVVGADDQLIPGKAQGRAEIADERRLLYVSLTRAREHLHVTHCRLRTGQQAHKGRNDGGRRRLTDFLQGAPTAT